MTDDELQHWRERVAATPQTAWSRAAFRPDDVLGLIAEVERLQAELDTAVDALHAIHDKPMGAWTYGELQVLEMRLRGEREPQP